MMKIKNNNRNFSLSLFHLLVIAIIFCGVLLFVLKPVKATADEIFLDNFGAIYYSCCFGDDAWGSNTFSIASTTTSVNKLVIYAERVNPDLPELWNDTDNVMIWKATSTATPVDNKYTYEFSDILLDSSKIYKVSYKVGTNPYLTEEYGIDANSLLLSIDNWTSTEKGLAFQLYFDPDYKELPSGIFNIEILEDPLILNKYADKDVNFSFNFCGNYRNIKHAVFGFGDLRNPGQDNEWIDNLVHSKVVNLRDIQISPQICQGMKTLVLDKTDVEALYEDHELDNLVWYVEGEDINDNYFYETYPINYTFSDTSENYLQSGVVSPLNVDIDANYPSTIISFNYNFENLDWEDSQVCLYNYSGKNSTNYCADIASAKGFGLINIPVPEAPVDFKFYFQSSISNNLKSNSFIVNFTNTDSDIALVDFQTGVDDFVPSAFEPFLAFLNKGKDIIKNTFPFGFLSSIAKSWEDSKNASSSISFFSFIDNEGNIKFTPSSKLTGNTNTTIVLFGPAIFNNADLGIGPLFAEIRNISTYLLWGLFFFLLYKFARDFYKELNENK